MTAAEPSRFGGTRRRALSAQRRRAAPRPGTPISGAMLEGLKNPMDVFSAQERRDIEKELDEQARARRRAEADGSTIRLG